MNESTQAHVEPVGEGKTYPPLAITFEDVRRDRKPIRNVNIEQKERLTKLERFALWMTERVGSMGFFILILVWTVVWLAWNIFAPLSLQFDPFPAFVLWLFISNMIQLLFLPLIMVGQNLQGRHAEARAEADFELNVKSSQEIEAILLHLERQSDLIVEILNRLNSRK